MKEHQHVSLASFLVFIAQFLLAGFLIRGVEARFPNSSAAKALATIH